VRSVAPTNLATGAPSLVSAHLYISISLSRHSIGHLLQSYAEDGFFSPATSLSPRVQSAWRRDPSGIVSKSCPCRLGSPAPIHATAVDAACYCTHTNARAAPDINTVYTLVFHAARPSQSAAN